MSDDWVDEFMHLYEEQHPEEFDESYVPEDDVDELFDEVEEEDEFELDEDLDLDDEDFEEGGLDEEF